MVGDLSIVEAVKLVDGVAVAGVLGLLLRWALRQIEEKDKIIIDLANRFAAGLEKARRRGEDDRGDG